MEPNFNDIVIKTVEMSFKISSERGVKRVIKNRKFDAFILATTGVIVYSYGNKEFVSDGKNILFVPKGLSYSLVCEEDDVSYVVNFCSDLNAKDMMVFPGRSIETEAVIENLFRASIERNQSSQNKMKMFLYKLIIDNICIKEEHYPVFIKKAIEYINANIANPSLRVDDVAMNSAISTVYLNKEFQKYLKTSPRQYIISRRMALAESLLLSLAFSANEVGQSCGYSSAARFSKAFSQYHNGVTPLQYRNSRS